MHKNTFQRQGDPAQVGWSFGHMPLWLRGIRCAEGDGGAPPAAPPAAAQPAAGTPSVPAPNPAQVAAFYAAQNGVQAPPTAPAPTPAPVQQVQGFTPEQVQKLMTESETAQKAAKDAQDALAAAQKERDEFQAQVTQFTRERAVTTAAAAAEKTGNAALLLDSASFQAAIKDVDLNDADALKAAVSKFVTDNPAYAAQPAQNLPGTSGGTPSGGAATTLEQQLEAAQKKGDQTEIIRLTREIAYAKRG